MNLASLPLIRCVRVTISPIVAGFLVLSHASVLIGQDDPSGPRVLTLTEAISMALDQNLGLQLSGVFVEIRENEVEAERGDYQPNLTASASDTLR